MDKKVAENSEQLRFAFNISGMTCASCAGIVEKELNRMPESEFVSVNLATERGFVIARAGTTFAEIRETVKKAGYSASLEDSLHNSQQQNYYRFRKQMWQSLLIAVPIMILMILHMSGIMIPGFYWFELISGLLALAGPGRTPLKSAWIALSHRHTNMDTLIVLGSSAALCTTILALSGMDILSFGSLTSMLIALHLSGRFIESRLRQKAFAETRALIALQSRDALIRIADRLVSMPVDSIKPGHIAVVRAGEKVPLDGRVYSGHGLVEEALISGESLPAVKSAGSEVYGGTVLQTGYLEIEVTRVGEDTFLARMIKLVDQAQSGKVPIQAMADRITLVFIPLVLTLALLAALAWTLFYPQLSSLFFQARSVLPWTVAGTGALSSAVFVFVATLVIACPCALGLATPLALSAGSQLAAARGLIIKNGEAVQMLTEIDTVLLDKTGTITAGKPTVFATNLKKTDLQLAAALEQHSLHPLAGAISAYCSTAAANTEVIISAVKEIPGQGVRGRHENSDIFIGRPLNGQIYQNLLDQGSTIVEFRKDNRVAGYFAVRDDIKNGSLQAIRQLHKKNIRTVMVTGDHTATAAVVAGICGIKEYYGGLSPAEKVDQVMGFQQSGHKIAFIGDGLNDAAALKSADTGVAMGNGTDLAIDSADVIIVRGSLASFIDLLKIADLTFKKIRQNLFWAFLYNLFALPLAMSSLLHPVVAETAMFFSSVNVTLNSMSIKKKLNRKS